MKYLVGDRVTVRDWDEMADLYEADCDGDLLVPGAAPLCSVMYFTQAMREYCGRTFEVTVVDEILGYTLNGVPQWSFNDNMLRPAGEPKPEPIALSETEWLNILKGGFAP